MDKQLLSLHRQGSKSCTVQGSTDFFKVAKLTACVLGVHVSDPPVVKKIRPERSSFSGLPLQMLQPAPF